MSFEGELNSNPAAEIQNGQLDGGTVSDQQTQGTQGVNGLPHFKDEAAVADAYKNLQVEYTRTSQFNKQLESQVQQLLSWKQQQEQVAQQQAQQNKVDWLAADHNTLIDGMNQDAAGTLKQYVKALVEDWAGQNFNPVKSTAEEMSQMLATMQAQASLYNLKDRYSSLDPQFEDHLKKAGEFLFSDEGRLIAGAPNALEVAYKMVIADRINDPNFQQQMAQSFAQYNQQMTQQKQMAAPLTSNPTQVGGSHQPLGVMEQQGLQPGQIASWGENMFTQGPPLRVI